MEQIFKPALRFEKERKNYLGVLLRVKDHPRERELVGEELTLIGGGVKNIFHGSPIFG